MERKTSLFLALSFLSTIGPPIFAQDLQGRPDPVPPISILGPQLIAWSEMQKPQPILESVPQSGRNAQQANQKPELAPAQPIEPDQHSTSAIPPQDTLGK
jgi:hypothetical protein